ncbi:MAG: chemotaxis protein CheR [Candidatus Accumulibacter sp.]|jgi:chemotaxis protein methyltransferase CheR|nr:chemotaxis protein CheR [Accumulibacter sp.]
MTVTNSTSLDGLLLHDNGQREFVFTRIDFEQIRKLIYEHAGISLTEAKQDMVYSRLAKRLRDRNLKSFGEYLALLKKGDKPEWERFVNCLTTNLTSFFREPHHFPILATHLKKLQGKSPIRIWCCAASTGEEPYSIAMTVVETFNSFNVPVSIFASDLDTSVLAMAAKGVYTGDRVERLSRERLHRFFSKNADGSFTVRPELRRLVNFQRLNLLESFWGVRGPLDALFCRNIMIYFDKPTQYKILKRFVPLMDDKGLLFAGHSESFLYASDLFRLQGKTVYELANHKPK